MKVTIEKLSENKGVINPNEKMTGELLINIEERGNIVLNLGDKKFISTEIIEWDGFIATTKNSKYRVIRNID